MSKNYRVKRYYGKGGGGLYRAKPHPLTVLTAILIFAALGYAGTIIYRPVYDFVMNIGKPQEILYTEPEEPSEPERSEVEKQEPETPGEPEYDKIRAVYVPFETAVDETLLNTLLTELSGTRINAVMVDIKNEEGDVLYKTSNKTAEKWGVIAPNALDLKEFAQKLEEESLDLIVKMSVFRDPKAASAGRFDYAIRYQQSNYLWLDAAPENDGKPWLNPYSAHTREYIESLALESVDIGAKMVVLENVRFPDNSGLYAYFGPDAETIGGRDKALREFVGHISGLTEEKGARAVVYYPVTEETRDQDHANRYGGSPFKIPERYVLLGAQPSLFGTGYSEGGLEIERPLENPGGAVKSAVNYARGKLSDETQIIPVLQGGNDMPFNNAQSYGSAQVEAQAAAASALGLQEYILYNANGVYLLR